MSRTHKITNLLRSHLLASIALFVALGGSAYAADTVFSTDIVDGEVKTADVQDEGLTGTDIQGLTGADVTDNSLNSSDVAHLTGSDVDNNTLTGSDVEGIGTADVTDNSLTGSDISALGGGDVTNDSLTGSDIDENSLSVTNMGCKNGLVKGFARIKGTSGVPSAYVDETAYIDRSHTCAAGSRIEVRRESEGVYFVRFTDNTASLAIAVPNQDGASTSLSGDADNTITVGKVSSGNDAGAFRVDVHDEPDSVRQDGQFTIALL